MIRTLKIASILLLAIVQSCLLKQEIDKETYYIPDGFTGKVLVLFNCKDGKPKEWTDDGRRLYRIPESGVLKTQFKPNTGSRYEYDDPKKQIKSLRDYYKFFYVDDNGGKTLLDYNYLYSPNFKNLFNDNTNVTSGIAIFGFSSYNNEKYSAISHYVSKGIDTKLKQGMIYTGKGITDSDWYRIRHWNTFNAVKDTIPLLKPQKNK